MISNLKILLRLIRGVAIILVCLTCLLVFKSVGQESDIACIAVPNIACVQCYCQNGNGSWNWGAEQCSTLNEGWSPYSYSWCSQEDGENFDKGCRVEFKNYE